MLNIEKGCIFKPNPDVYLNVMCFFGIQTNEVFVVLLLAKSIHVFVVPKSNQTANKKIEKEKDMTKIRDLTPAS